MIVWDEAKNEKLAAARDVRFEDVIVEIVSGRVLDILEHRVRKNQKILVVNLGERVHAVPFLWDSDGNMILKTIYPTRKLQRRYGKKAK
ncbi:MAG: toxin [Acidobacteriia bacterium]|nr:toxin [Terriglobia bacterium]